MHIGPPGQITGQTTIFKIYVYVPLSLEFLLANTLLNQNASLPHTRFAGSFGPGTAKDSKKSLERVSQAGSGTQIPESVRPAFPKEMPATREDGALLADKLLPNILLRESLTVFLFAWEFNKTPPEPAAKGHLHDKMSFLEMESSRVLLCK